MKPTQSSKTTSERQTLERVRPEQGATADSPAKKPSSQGTTTVESLALFPEENPSPVLRTTGGGILLYANPASAELLREWNCQVGGLVPEFVLQSIAQTFAKKSAQELELTCGGRELSFVLVPIRQRNYVNFYGRDLTEQKRAIKELREGREDLKRAQAVAHTGSWRLNVQRNELLWSDENHRVFGVPKGAQLNYQTFLSIVHPEDQAYVDEMWTAALRGTPYDIEHRLLIHDKVKWVRERAELEFDREGRLLGGFGTTQDITSKKETEERLEASLHEKEVLLREIHHRVKNNLQVISSLIKLQMDTAETPRIRRLFQDIRDRVRSMALVHETLYASDSLTRVNFSEYTRSLMEHLWRAHATDADIRLTLDLDPIELSVDLAVPCGLIINELTTNALVHAFVGRKEGQVNLVMKHHPRQQITLSVSDNGKGLPPEMNFQESKSMGLKLVHLLASQLGGKLRFERDQGTSFILEFPAQKTRIGSPMTDGKTRP